MGKDRRGFRRTPVVKVGREFPYFAFPLPRAPGLAAHQPSTEGGSETAFTSAVPEAPERETR
jgi:hypothetical protein